MIHIRHSRSAVSIGLLSEPFYEWKNLETENLGFGGAFFISKIRWLTGTKMDFMHNEKALILDFVGILKQGMMTNTPFRTKILGRGTNIMTL